MDGELISMFLKRNIRMVLMIGVLLGLLTLGIGVMFPEMATGDAQAVAASWPPMMKALFGDPLAGFTNIYAWLNLEIFHVTLWISLGTLAAILASRIVAREAEQRTLDLLLSIPRSRSVIVASRFLAVGSLVMLAVLPVALGSLLAVATRGIPVQVTPILLSTLAGALLSLVIAGITLFISIWIPRQISAIAISLGITGLFFFIEEMLVHVVPALTHLSPINPFHWYETGDILIRGVFTPWPLLVLFAMTLCSAMLSAAAFTIRDIRI